MSNATLTVAACVPQWYNDCNNLGDYPQVGAAGALLTAGPTRPGTRHKPIPPFPPRNRLSRGRAGAELASALAPISPPAHRAARTPPPCQPHRATTGMRS